MGYLYLLAPIALELGCIIHAVKTGRIFPWIYVIIFLPMLGSIAYLAVEVAPEFLRSRASRQLAAGMRAAADPDRGFRQAKRAAETVGSVEAKRALAEQHIARGQYREAVALYRDMLGGQFRDDPALLQGLARAQFLDGDGGGAQATLDALQRADPNFVSADVRLLYARSLELQGKNEEALSEYERLLPYFAGEEARCRYALLLQKTGREVEARHHFGEILKSVEDAPKHYRRAQRQWADIARAGSK